MAFFPIKFLDFRYFLLRSWQLLLARLARLCKIFQDRGKKSKKNFGLFDKKTKNIQDIGKRTKKNLGFLAKKILGFLRFAKILANIFGEVDTILQDFSRSWKKNPRKFLAFLATKPRISKILARQTRKSCINLIQL